MDTSNCEATPLECVAKSEWQNQTSILQRPEYFLQRQTHLTWMEDAPSLSPITEISNNLADAVLTSSALDTNGISGRHHHKPLQKIQVDELSFYDDNELEGYVNMRHFVSPPPLVGLLSYETSPQQLDVDKSFGVKERGIAMRTARGFGAEDGLDFTALELLEQQLSKEHTPMPNDLSSLFSGEIKSPAIPKCAIDEKTPENRRPQVRRCLTMAASSHRSDEITPEPAESALSIRGTLPRGELESPLCRSRRLEQASPCSTRPKRQRANEKINFTTTRAPVNAARRIGGGGGVTLRKSMSMNDADIMTALARSESREEPELIGDLSKPFALPLVEGRHCDLKSISTDTMARLIRGEFANQVMCYKIIDCRYPYEFEGGHIRGALNLYTHEHIIEHFLPPQLPDKQKANEDVNTASEERSIAIFHCEFSSERAPKLLRFLRNKDRERNNSAYPVLHHPEIYLLHNGYKAFYEAFAELCDPVAYRPMLEPSYTDAYRHFRVKSKSWNGEGSGGTTSSRLKRVRPRHFMQ